MRTARLVWLAAAALAFACLPVVRAGMDADLPVVRAGMDADGMKLDEMKEAFAGLMKERAGLGEQSRAHMQRIRDTGAAVSGPRAHSETARAYRAAALAVEQAIDAHPRIRALQGRHDALQAEKVEISRQQAKIVDAWHDTTEDAARLLNEAVAVATRKAEDERQAIFKNAGVKNPDKLSEEDRLLMREIQIRFTNELTTARTSYERVAGTNAVIQARERDGSGEAFEAINARQDEIQREQTEIKGEMARLRNTLRSDDPAIAEKQRAAVEASRKHQSVLQADPEVAEAKAFLGGVNARRAEIDKRARVLRQAILAADPACKPDLDGMAASAGLALADDAFWDVK